MGGVGGGEKSDKLPKGLMEFSCGKKSVGVSDITMRHDLTTLTTYTSQLNRALNMIADLAIYKFLNEKRNGISFSSDSNAFKFIVRKWD